MNIFESVEEFNKAVIGIDRNVGPIESADENTWLVGVLNEETDEYFDAVTDQDFIGQIDAMIDTIYFAAGALTRMGIPADAATKMFSHVHQCNMQKRAGAKEQRTKSIDLDATKPECWVGPEEGIAAILSTIK